MQEEEDEDTLRFPYSKRQRVNRPHVRDIPDIELTLLRDTVAEVTEKTLGKLTTKQTNWTTTITTKVNQLARTVTEVRDTMQAGTHGVTQSDALAAPIMIPPLTIEMPAEALSKKGTKNEESLHNLDTMILNFSKLKLP